MFDGRQTSQEFEDGKKIRWGGVLLLAGAVCVSQFSKLFGILNLQSAVAVVSHLFCQSQLITL